VGLKRRLWNLFLAMLADTLADLEGIRDEIRAESGPAPPNLGSFRVDPAPARPGAGLPSPVATRHPRRARSSPR
jgi:hypothetical protein